MESSYSSVRGDKRRGVQALTQSFVPQIFDPEPQFVDEWETPDVAIIQKCMTAWGLATGSVEAGLFADLCLGQTLNHYQPWQTLFPFGARANEMFLVVRGTYIRVIGRTTKGSSPTLFPVFQVIQTGAILGPGALGEPEGPSTVEACICVEEGEVIQIKNPSQVVRIDSVSRTMAQSRNRDAKWLQEKMFVLQRSEDRARALIRSLARWKELDDSESKLTFVHPISQSALADCLGMSDNTLRPYLKSDSYEWLSGKLWMTRDFVAATGRPGYDY
ncbi:MAG: hypothetical protein P4L46_20820 [Fimbriimonas sp.]|nr:hypothetical protein [Fimbriimonas sp.]